MPVVRRAQRSLDGYQPLVPFPKRYTHLIGAKFTSVAELRGWRQFHVVGLRKVSDGYDAELRASCDAAVEVRVPAKSLFDRDAWTPGWSTLAELTERR